MRVEATLHLGCAHYALYFMRGFSGVKGHLSRVFSFYALLAVGGYVFSISATVSRPLNMTLPISPGGGLVAWAT